MSLKTSKTARTFAILAFATALGLLSNLTFIPPADARPEGKNAEWLLIQNHADLGEVKFYITHDAVKGVVSKTGCCLLAKAPDWKLNYYRDDDRAIWTGSMDQLEPASLVNPFNRSFARKSPPIKVRRPDVPYCDLNSQLNVELIGNGTTQGLHYNEYSLTIRKQRTVFWLTKDIAVAPPVTKLLCRFYGVPEMTQIPLYVRKNMFGAPRYADEFARNKVTPFFPEHGQLMADLRSGPQLTMTTKSCKRIPYDGTVFDAPRNYERRVAIVDVTYSGKLKNEITNMMGDMAFTSDRSKSAGGHGK